MQSKRKRQRRDPVKQGWIARQLRQIFGAWRRKVIVLVMGLMAGTSALAYYCPQYDNDTVGYYFNLATGYLIYIIEEMDAALAYQLYEQDTRLTSAIAVLVKQKAVGANQISDVMRNSSQNVAVGLSALDQAERIKTARFEYGGDFGQGYSPCYVLEERLALAQTEEGLSGATADAVRSNVEAAPGRFADPVAAENAMLTQHSQLFCTADQANSGLCSAQGPLPGANLTVATLFKPTVSGEDLDKAKGAFINNLAGLPDGPIPKSGAGSQSTAAYEAAKIRKDALNSTALASLQGIALETTSTQSDADSNGNLPLSQQYDTEVKRYIGNTDENKIWASVLATQNERGLLVELLKNRALILALQEKQYRQWERMEAMLAALAASKIQDMQEKTNSAADEAMHQAAAHQVR